MATSYVLKIKGHDRFYRHHLALPGGNAELTMTNYRGGAASSTDRATLVRIKSILGSAFPEHEWTISPNRAAANGAGGQS